ncbi:MAG: HEAT repeat domain-containing protein, partial [Cytophagales bacterium]|nr:HEAT repeat domain-containing protein [Cytophagales bacterium]
LSFLSGEVSKKQGVAGIRQLLSLLEAEPQEVVGVQHVLLQMRLLNEWLGVAGEDLEDELAALEEEFHVMDSLVEWFQEGLKRVRRRDDSSWDDRQLLSLLTTALQSSRAVAAQAPALLEFLQEAMRDRSPRVRSAARSALGEVVKAAPAKQVLPPLIEAMRDRNYDVRRAASSALGEVVKAAPAHAEQVLLRLIEAMRDDNDPYGSVRSAASSALGEISLQQLIETYWATQNQGLKQGLIPIIATQLYHTPLLVRTSLKPHHQQLILYPTAGKHVKWDKPQQEVQRFVQQIKNAAKRNQKQRQ